MKKISIRDGKYRLINIAVVLIVMAGLILWGHYLSNRHYGAVDPQDKKVLDLIIPDKSSAKKVAGLLYSQDLIHSETAFLSYVRKNGFEEKLLAGHYKLSRSQSLAEIVDIIVSGKIVNIPITIPEGYTISQIGELLVKKEIVTQEDWNAAINKDYDYEFLKNIPANCKEHLEGYLFPDTYFIADNTDAQEIVNQMLNGFNNMWEKDFRGQAANSKLELHQIITLASLIEKEAKIEKERKTISGVIKNRLQKNMLLQIDATVLYSLGKHKDVVFYNDLEIDSLYNTYKHIGLPPGPIACPGRASIDAALNPEKHSYYYYCTKGDGSHVFTSTFDEHLVAKRKYIE